jgi:hypothetical protein
MRNNPPNKHPGMRMIFSTARVSSTARLNWGSDFPYHGFSAVILVPHHAVARSVSKQGLPENGYFMRATKSSLNILIPS